VTDKREQTEAAVPPAKLIVHRDVPHAPILYFEAAPNFGFHNGIVNVTLSVSRAMPTEDGQAVANDAVVVGYLKCNIPGALSLRKSIDDALLLAAPVSNEKPQ
jgi:hypothetical protein